MKHAEAKSYKTLKAAILRAKWLRTALGTAWTIALLTATAIAQAKATPTITWATPAPISFGTPLSSAQLDATASVAGTFVYSPAAGTKLAVGAQTLSVTFTPSDTTSYTTATAQVTLTVNKVAPSITWHSPAAIAYGTALSSTQLDANTGGVSGTYVYTPAAGTVLGAGSQTLSVTFSPTNTATFIPSTGTTTLMVNQSSLRVTANASFPHGTSGFTFTPIYSGFVNGDTASSLSGAPNCTTTATPSSPIGTYPITCTAGTLSSPNYSFTFATGTLTITKVTPTITWTAPTTITYGTPLSATQLDANAGGVAGTFAYSPTACAFLPGGSNSLSVAFTPSDATDYASNSAQVLQVVTQAQPTMSITSSNTSSAFGGSVTFTATLSGVSNSSCSPAAPSAPTGTVTFYDGSTAIGTVTISSATATLTTSSLLTGTHNIIAISSGDGNYLGASSTPVTQTVSLASGELAQTVVSIPSQPNPIPANFLGLSTDWTQPTAMMGQASTGVNTAYRQLLKNLTQYSSAPLLLRIEGDNSTASNLQPDIEPLKELAQAVNVNYTLGVDLMNNNVATAETEALQWASGIPMSLIQAFEIGNEPDAYSAKGSRPSSYSFASYLADFQQWQQGVLSSAGSNFSLMGPSFAGSAWNWQVESAMTAGTFSPTIVSQHAYLSGPASGQSLPPDYLLQPASATKLPNMYASYANSAHQAGHLFRMGEINSIGGGGVAGISNSFSSALWSIDLMFKYLASGIDGVNWHSGQYTAYELFEFAPKTTNGVTTFGLTKVTPLYYGLLAFAQMAGRDAQLLSARTTTNANVSVWATEDNASTVHVIVINKDEQATGNVQIDIPGYSTGTLRYLSAPSYTSTNGVTFGGQTFDGSTDGAIKGTLSVSTITGTLQPDGTYSFTLPNMPTTSAALIDLTSAANQSGKNTSTMTLASSNSPSTYGNAVILTATFTSGAGPTGSVTFTSNGAVLGSAAISGNTASITNNTLSTGDDVITATYSGDANYNAAAPVSISQRVDGVTPTLTVATSGSPSVYGGAVTLTATISSGSTPTGTVNFTSNGMFIGTGAVSNGTATATTPALLAGNDSIVATYSGDTHNNAVTSAPFTQVVGKLTPGLTVAASPGSPTYNAAVTITATFASGAGPTGTVSFTANGSPIGSAEVIGNAATLTTTALSAGSVTIAAGYSADANYNSVSPYPTTRITVAKATPTLALASSSSTAIYGDAVTFTATFTSGAGPTGSVSFTANGIPIGSAPINGNTAILTTTALPAGPNGVTVQASYSGDISYGAAPTVSLSESVTKETPTLTIASTTSSLTYGSQVTLTATFTSGAGPTTSIIFVSNGSPIGTASIIGNTATLTTTALLGGPDEVFARYSGDANYNAVNSSAITETVSKATPTLTVASSSATSTYGTQVTLTATFTSVSIPTGSVIFTCNNHAIGQAAISGNTVTLTTSNLPVTTTTPDSITAQYLGDANFNAVFSPAIQHTVNTNTPSMTLSSSSSTPTFGTSVTLTVTFTNTSNPPPTGTVAFSSSNGGFIGTAMVNGNTAALTTTSLLAGGNTITATYSGDTNYSSCSPPNCPTITLNVAKLALNLAVTSSLSSVTFGAPVTLTATLSGSSTPSDGTMTFYHCCPAIS